MAIIHKTFAQKVSEVADEIIAPLVEPVVIDYLEANPPAGGLTIDQIKADSDIADSLSKKHSSGSDNQDLSNLVVKVSGSSLVADTEIAKIHALGLDNQDISGKVDKITNYSLVLNTEISKIHTAGSDDQDLSGLQLKETGKGLSTNDYTTAEQTKLSGIEASANNYTHPANHAPSIITQDVSNRFVSDTEKGTWNGKTDLSSVKADTDIADAISKKHSNSLDHSHSNKSTLDSVQEALTTVLKTGYDGTVTHSGSAHAPSNAQKNSDITKAEIEAQLTGAITTHTHSAAPTFKCGIATKNINDASITQNIAHGLGRVPKVVRVSGHCVYASTLSEICQGVYDGTNHNGISICMTEGTTTATIDNIYNSATQELGFTALGTTSPFSGANKQSGIITVDATNIIITWTKTGTVTSNVVNILWEVC